MASSGREIAAVANLSQRGRDMLGMRRRMLDFPKPRPTIRGVMNHEIVAGILAADFARGAVTRFGPRANLDRHRVCVRVVAYRRFQAHGSKFRSQKALWTVSPSASVTTRNQRWRSATQNQCLMRPSRCRARRAGWARARRTSARSMLRRSGRLSTSMAKYRVRQNGGGGSRSTILKPLALPSLRSHPLRRGSVHNSVP
jgi:hypothetical protein